MPRSRMAAPNVYIGEKNVTSRQNPGMHAGQAAANRGCSLAGSPRLSSSQARWAEDEDRAPAEWKQDLLGGKDPSGRALDLDQLVPAEGAGHPYGVGCATAAKGAGKQRAECSPGLHHRDVSWP